MKEEAEKLWGFPASACVGIPGPVGFVPPASPAGGAGGAGPPWAERGPTAENSAVPRSARVLLKPRDRFPRGLVSR